MNETTQIQSDLYPEALLINIGHEVQGKITEALSQAEIKWSSYYRNWSTKLKYSNLMPTKGVQKKAYSVFVFDYNSFDKQALPKWLDENFFFLDKISKTIKYPIVVIFEAIKENEFDDNDVEDYFKYDLKLPCYVTSVNLQKHKWNEEIIEYINEAWKNCINTKDLEETSKELRKKYLEIGECLTKWPFETIEQKYLNTELKTLFKNQLNKFDEALGVAGFEFDVNYNPEYSFQNFKRFTDSIVGENKDLLIEVFKTLLASKPGSKILKKCVEDLTS